jgi:glutamate-ammonia-ligase adenylyltransferase
MAARWRCARSVAAFVYRRYLDYGVFEGLRSCTARCATKRSAAPRAGPSAPTTSSCSRGGIREIEFIVQLLLVVRGGQFPEIRTRSTLKALDKLAAGG